MNELPATLLLDGEESRSLAQKAAPAGSCPEHWLAQEPATLQRYAAAYEAAGCRLISTPTQACDSDHLAHWGLEEDCVELNRRLAQLCQESLSQEDSLVAGRLAPLALFAQPLGDTPLLDLVNIYAQQAFALKWGGAKVILADHMSSLAHCRAALLGAKQTGLPVCIALEVEPDGETQLGCDLVSALIVCQSLGASAFGISSRGLELERLEELLDELLPYSLVPLLLKRGPDGLAPEPWAQEMLQLRRRGAAILGGGEGVSPAYFQALSPLLAQEPAPRLEPLDTEVILMAGEKEPYFLDELFEQSEPIPCGYDMADRFLELEELGSDVVTIQLDSPEDAYNFAENAHMLRRPVSFLSDDEEALEMALLLYNGRAFVDSRSALPEETLRALARGYGALLR